MWQLYGVVFAPHRRVLRLYDGKEFEKGYEKHFFDGI